MVDIGTYEFQPNAPGDVNGDGCVDQADLGALLAAYCSYPGDPNWNPWADFDCNDHVGQPDLGALLGHWGEACP